MSSGTCLELALEGERLCKTGEFEAGINFFEAAVNIGTEDLKTLSAIYSQLGNAFFYMNNYEKALHYHNLDYQLAKRMKDMIGEAKAFGNLGNTYKMLARFDDAHYYCSKHLEICRLLNDKVGEGRALYNLGNVYHTKGKHLAKLGCQDPGDFPEDVKDCLLNAVDYYQKNLDLVTKLGDKAAQGRAQGNIGNTHYLLGNFDQAIAHHQSRLVIAREFCDKAAERRAHCNLGNSHIFLGNFEQAIHEFKQSLQLSQDLNDQVLEAQGYYSLGNTYTLLRDFKQAIDYHVKHLEIALSLKDAIGESRAYWSLCNAYTAIGNHREALKYAQMHLEISTQIGDAIGKETAAKSIRELRNILSNDDDKVNIQSRPSSNRDFSDRVDVTRRSTKRQSMENMDLLSLTPTKDSGISSAMNRRSATLEPSSNGRGMFENKENRHPEVSQNKRSISSFNSGASTLPSGVSFENFRSISNACINDSQPHENQGYSNAGFKREVSSESCHEEMFDLIEKFQSRTLDEQRAPLPSFGNLQTKIQTLDIHGERIINPQSSSRLSSRPKPPRSIPSNSRMNTSQPSSSSHISVDGSTIHNEDDFFEQLMRSQANRLEDQRCELPSANYQRSNVSHGSETLPAGISGIGVTLPNDDFFNHLVRVQSARLDDQRLPHNSSTSRTLPRNYSMPARSSEL